MAQKCSLWTIEIVKEYIPGSGWWVAGDSCLGKRRFHLAPPEASSDAVTVRQLPSLLSLSLSPEIAPLKGANGFHLLVAKSLTYFLCLTTHVMLSSSTSDKSLSWEGFHPLMSEMPLPSRSCHFSVDFLEPFSGFLFFCLLLKHLYLQSCPLAP